MKVYLLYVLSRLSTSTFYLGAPIKIAKMCIVFLFPARDRGSAEKKYPRGILSWLRQHFVNDKNSHSNGQGTPPSYEKAMAFAKSRVGDVSESNGDGLVKGNKIIL